MGSKKIVHGRITVGKTRWKKTLELRCLDRSGCQERAAWRSLYRSCARGWRSKAVRWVTCYNRSGHHVSGAEYDSTDSTNYEGIRQKYVPTIEKKGYVGLSLSVLLAQHNQVMAVDIVQAKVDMINNHKSPIQDD